MNAAAITLQRMLEVENDASIAEFVCPDTGIALWTQVRIVFFVAMMSDLLYGAPVTGRAHNRSQPARAAATMARSVGRNLRFRLTGRCRAKVCIMGNGIADEWNGKAWHNRLSDHFALAQGDESLVVADHFEWRWAYPRANERTMLHAPQQALHAIADKLAVRDRHRKRAALLIDIVCRRAEKALGWTPGPRRRQAMIDRLAAKSAGLGFKLRNYAAMLAAVEPKVLLVDAACYGPAACLIAAARRNGIVTAEYQHGSISGGHVAYNFGPALLNDAAFTSTLPEHFLSYGTWWSEQINAPVRHWTVGNPHRTAKLAQAVGDAGPQDDILILSDGIDFPRYLALAQELAPTAKRLGLTIRLRPHPLERTLVEASYGVAIGNVTIDRERDLYASIRRAHAVVSEVSTGLFEAAGVARKLFLWDTPKARFGFPSHPFESFSSAPMLLDQLQCPNSGALKTDGSEAIWASGWRQRYAGFLQAQNALDVMGAPG